MATRVSSAPGRSRGSLVALLVLCLGCSAESAETAGHGVSAFGPPSPVATTDTGDGTDQEGGPAGGAHKPDTSPSPVDEDASDASGSGSPFPEDAAGRADAPPWDSAGDGEEDEQPGEPADAWNGGGDAGGDAATATDAEPTEDDDAWSLPDPCIPMQGDCGGIVYGKSLTAYPIVLAHGAAGFDEIGPLEYWWDIPDVLRDKGYEVHVAVVSPFDTSVARGAQLAAFIDKVLLCTCRKKVNLIGHSQGGLDSRYVVSSLGYADRVSSVTTIGTPHRGTPAADLALGIVPGATEGLVNFFLWWVSGLYPNPFEEPDFMTAIEQLTTEGAASFNAANPDAPAIDYYSWAGRAGLFADGKPECEGAELPNPSAKGPVQAAFSATWVALGGWDGIDNDGLVTVESAKWGRFRGCLPADHLREIGFWWGVTPGFDYREFFVDLAAFLKSEGH